MTKKKLGEAYRYPYAMVAFGGKKTYWWTRFLRKGFYHCLVLFGDGYEWIIVDPVLGFTDLIKVKNSNAEDTLENMGYTLLDVTVNLNYKKVNHLRPLTCVETVKRFLGITNPFIFTPYQLYKYIIDKESK